MRQRGPGHPLTRSALLHPLTLSTTLILSLGTAQSLTGCGNSEFSDMKVDAQGLLQVKNTSWDSPNGVYVHELTLYNGSDVGAKDIVIRFHYLDGDGKEVGTFEATFPDLIEAQKSLQYTGVEGGPSSMLTRKVTYEVVKAKATWKGRKKGE